MKKFNIICLISFLIILGSCEPNDIESQETVVSNGSLQNLDTLLIPDGFNFETERDVTLNITDETPFVKYEVYGYSSKNGSGLDNISDALNNLLYSGKPFNGVISQVLSLSNIYDKVYISRKDGLEYSFEIKDISNNTIDFTSPLATKSTNNSNNSNNGNRTLCPECDGEIFKNGSFDLGPFLPNTYFQRDESDVEGWSTTSPDGLIELWKSGFLGVTSQDGGYHAELNATQPSALYQRICTTPNATITWSVWHRGREGVDVATVRIGEDLSTATVEKTMQTSNSAGYINDNGDVANANGWINYTGTYTVPSGQTDTFLIFEAVSSTFNPSYGNFIDGVVITETSPGDACSGNGSIFYPSGLNKANIAFEDLWPSQGDYDFNDLVISYRIVSYINTPGAVVSMDYIYTIENIGAAYNNGFGIELEGVSPSAIESVTGQQDGFMGAEPGKANAVIRFFDDADSYLGIPNTISIVFSSPITTAALGTAPFNPFLVENGDADFEVHLSDKPTTAPQAIIIPGFAPAFAQDIVDLNGDFKVDAGVQLDVPPLTDMENMPWAINIAGTYVAPLPGEFIVKGHLKFREWAQSGGVNFPDWFLNTSGYRDNNFLDN